MKTNQDDYKFLEDSNDLRTKKFKEESKFETRQYFKKNKFKSKFKIRLKEIQNTDARSNPYIIKNGMIFYSERKKGEKVGSVYYQNNSKVTRIIDGEEIFKKSNLILTSWKPSKNGDYIFYSVSKLDNDKNYFYIFNIFLNVPKKQDIPDFLHPIFLEWDISNKGFFYSRSEKNNLNRKVYYHKLNNNYKKDTLVFKDKKTKANDWPHMDISEDGMYNILSVFHLSDKLEWNDSFIKINNKKNSIKLPGKKGCISYFYFYKEFLYRLTNESAPMWKVQRLRLCDLNKNNKKAHWDNLIKEGNDVILSINIFTKYILVNKFKKNKSCLELYDLKGNYIKNLKSSGIVEDISTEPHSNIIYLNTSSFLDKNKILRQSLEDEGTDIFFESKINFTKEKFIQKVIYAKSRDGLGIPINLVYKKGLKMNGKNILLCYGYGGFGEIVKPTFNSLAIPLIEKGGIYAEIIIRGGGEFGSKWHEAGRLTKKQNSFNDFADAIKYMFKKGYSNPLKTAIYGWSNGGLLVSAVTVQNPNLMRVSIIGSPLTDMARFHLFNSGEYWIGEYGDPRNPNHLKNILKYSPYHNLKKDTAYPSILVLTGEEDDRVNPMHSYKFVYKIKKENKETGKKRILLRIEEKSGHSGSSILDKNIDQNSDILSFIFKELQ